MTLRDLTLQELHHLHRHELREAFPPEELKPFAAMKKLYRAGVYPVSYTHLRAHET